MQDKFENYYPVTTFMLRRTNNSNSLNLIGQVFSTYFFLLLLLISTVALVLILGTFFDIFKQKKGGITFF